MNNETEVFWDIASKAIADEVLRFIADDENIEIDLGHRLIDTLISIKPDDDKSRFPVISRFPIIESQRWENGKIELQLNSEFLKLMAEKIKSIKT